MGEIPPMIVAAMAQAFAGDPSPAGLRHAAATIRDYYAQLEPWENDTLTTTVNASMDYSAGRRPPLSVVAMVAMFEAMAAELDDDNAEVQPRLEGLEDAA